MARLNGRSPPRPTVNSPPRSPSVTTASGPDGSSGAGAAPVAKAWRAAATAANGRGVTAASYSPAASQTCRAACTDCLRMKTASACRSDGLASAIGV